jgi:hypothetical protein
MYAAFQIHLRIPSSPAKSGPASKKQNFTERSYPWWRTFDVPQPMVWNLAFRADNCIIRATDFGRFRAGKRPFEARFAQLPRTPYLYPDCRARIPAAESLAFTAKAGLQLKSVNCMKSRAAYPLRFFVPNPLATNLRSPRTRSPMRAKVRRS